MPAGGLGLVSGSIPASASLTASGVTRSGVSVTATLKASTVVNGRAVVSFPSAGGSIVLNISALITALGNSASSFELLSGLNAGGESGQSYEINTRFIGLTLSTLSAVAPTPVNDFNLLVSFQ